MTARISSRVGVTCTLQFWRRARQITGCCLRRYFRYKLLTTYFSSNLGTLARSAYYYSRQILRRLSVLPRPISVAKGQSTSARLCAWLGEEFRKCNLSPQEKPVKPLCHRLGRGCLSNPNTVSAITPPLLKTLGDRTFDVFADTFHLYIINMKFLQLAL